MQLPERIYLVLAVFLSVACERIPSVPGSACDEVIQDHESYVLVDLRTYQPGAYGWTNIIVSRYAKYPTGQEPEDSLYIGDHIRLNGHMLRIDAHFPFPDSPDYAEYYYLLRSVDQKLAYVLRNIEVKLAFTPEECTCCYRVKKSYLVNNTLFEPSATLDQDPSR